MKEVELVIKIPEKIYESVMDGTYCGTLYEELKNGIALPKGHGRLVDESKIKKCGWNFIDHHAKTDAPTIIEADRSEKNG